MILTAIGCTKSYSDKSQGSHGYFKDMPQVAGAPLHWRHGHYPNRENSFPNDANVRICTAFTKDERYTDLEVSLASGEILLVHMSKKADWVNDIVAMQGNAKAESEIASSVLREGFFWGMSKDEIESAFGAKLLWKESKTEQRVSEGVHRSQLSKVMDLVVIFITHNEKLIGVQEYIELAANGTGRHIGRHFVDVLNREIEDCG